MAGTEFSWSAGGAADSAPAAPLSSLPAVEAFRSGLIGLAPRRLRHAQGLAAGSALADRHGGDDPTVAAAPTGIRTRRGGTAAIRSQTRRNEPPARPCAPTLGPSPAFARESPPRPTRRGAGRSPDRARSASRAAPARSPQSSSHASLNFSIARCSLVPAFDSLTPIASAISALPRPAKNFSAISSRSRGDERRQRRAQHRPPHRPPRRPPRAPHRAASSTGSSASSVWRLRRRSSSRAALRAIPNSQPRWLPRLGSKLARRR